MIRIWEKETQIENYNMGKILRVREVGYHILERISENVDNNSIKHSILDYYGRFVKVL